MTQFWCLEEKLLQYFGIEGIFNPLWSYIIFVRRWKTLYYSGNSCLSLQEYLYILLFSFAGITTPRESDTDFEEHKDELLVMLHEQLEIYEREKKTLEVRPQPSKSSLISRYPVKEEVFGGARLCPLKNRNHAYILIFMLNRGASEKGAIFHMKIPQKITGY